MSRTPSGTNRARYISAAACAALVPAMLTTTAATAPAASTNPVATVTVDLTADRHAIDPRIYGLNFATSAQLTDLRVPLNRSGGNTTSTYNWRLNADNKGNDWYFESIGYGSATAGQLHDTFIADSVAGGARPMVTIPMMGRVAKLGPNRGKLASYSVAKYGPQRATDAQWMPDAGNGVRLDGTLIKGDPNDASTPATVADQKAWIEHLVATHGAASVAKSRYYLYDNEPGLWAETHRDMVANGPTMQQLLDGIVAYGTMVRATDPAATLVGPEGWGWLDLKSAAPTSRLRGPTGGRRSRTGRRMATSTNSRGCCSNWPPKRRPRAPACWMSRQCTGTRKAASSAMTAARRWRCCVTGRPGSCGIPTTRRSRGSASRPQPSRGFSSGCGTTTRAPRSGSRSTRGAVTAP